MRPLTVQKIIDIQSRIILQSVRQEDRGMAGLIRSLGTIEHLVYYGNDIQNPLEKAAWMLHGIATRHPFYQGNKRTALATAEMILILSSENRMIAADDDAIYQFVRDIANYLHSIDEVEDWLIQNCKKIND